MMKISNSAAIGGNVQTARSASSVQTDSASKNIQNRIANLREQLQTISSDENMSAEDKMKKRQEIQQEISNLNQQLRQHEIEQRKEQQTKKAPAEDFPKPKRKASKKGGGLSHASMQAMISADTSMKQAQVQGSVASAMEGRAGVLESEIKQDAGRNNEDKEAELARVEQKSAEASSSQINTLSDANKALEEAARTEAEDTKRGGSSDKDNSKVKNKTAEIDTETQKTKSADSASDADSTGANVDIRL